MRRRYETSGNKVVYKLTIIWAEFPAVLFKSVEVAADVNYEVIKIN